MSNDEKSKNGPKATLAGLGLVGAYGALAYVEPYVAAGIPVGAIVGCAVGVVSGIALGAAAYVSYSVMKPEEAGRRDPENGHHQLMSRQLYTNARELMDNIMYGSMVFGVAGGAVTGAVLGFKEDHKKKANVIETVSKPVGFSQTLQEAADEFRGRTGQSVYVMGQQALTPTIS